MYQRVILTLYAERETKKDISPHYPELGGGARLYSSTPQDFTSHSIRAISLFSTISDSLQIIKIAVSLYRFMTAVNSQF